MYLDDGALVGFVLASISTIVDAEGEPKATAYGIEDVDTTPTTEYQNYKFIQTEELTSEGIAVHPWGGIVVPYLSGDEPGPSPKGGTKGGPVDPEPEEPSSTPTGDETIVIEYNGVQYGASIGYLLEGTVGTSITFEEISDDNGGGGGAEV